MLFNKAIHRAFVIKLRDTILNECVVTPHIAQAARTDLVDAVILKYIGRETGQDEDSLTVDGLCNMVVLDISGDSAYRMSGADRSVISEELFQLAQDVCSRIEGPCKDYVKHLPANDRTNVRPHAYEGPIGGDALGKGV